jgi:hypothetical protein
MVKYRLGRIWVANPVPNAAFPTPSAKAVTAKCKFYIRAYSKRSTLTTKDGINGPQTIAENVEVAGGEDESNGGGKGNGGGSGILPLLEYLALWSFARRLRATYAQKSIEQ